MQIQRTLLEELKAAGQEFDLLFPGSFTPTEELTPSTLPSKLSDLSEPMYSLRTIATETSSEEEVLQHLSQPVDTAPPIQGATTQSRARAQRQAQQPQASTSSSSPLASQQPIAIATTLHTASSAPPSTRNSPTLAAPQTQVSANVVAQVPPINAAPAQAAANPPVAANAPAQALAAANIPAQAQVPANVVAQVPAPAPAPPAPAPAPPAQVQAPAPIAPQQVAAIPAPMALANLPGRNERSAPSFDETQAEELDQYFDDLEALYTHFNVQDDEDKKQASVKYLKIRTGNLWKTTLAWSDTTKTYDEYKVEVYGLYPKAIGDRTYTGTTRVSAS